MAASTLTGIDYGQMFHLALAGLGAIVVGVMAVAVPVQLALWAIERARWIWQDFAGYRHERRNRQLYGPDE